MDQTRKIETRFSYDEYGVLRNPEEIAVVDTISAYMGHLYEGSTGLYYAKEFSSWEKVTNDSAHNLGYHAGKVIADVASAIGAGKLACKIFQDSKVGKKIIEKVTSTTQKAKTSFLDLFEKLDNTIKKDKNASRCFTGDTLVATNRGLIRMDEVNEGD